MAKPKCPAARRSWFDTVFGTFIAMSCLTRKNRNVVVFKGESSQLPLWTYTQVDTENDPVTKEWCESAMPSKSQFSTPQPTDDQALLSPDARKKLQQEFWRNLPAAPQILQSLDLLPNTFFFMKDVESRLIWGNQALLFRYGLRESWEIAGRTDHAFFPKHVVDCFIRDDAEVIRTGRPIIGRVEIWIDAQHKFNWFVTSKFPLVDRKGKPAGLFGVIQNHAEMEQATNVTSPLSVVLDYIENHSGQAVRVEDLAQAIGLSSRQLLRKFRQEFGMSIKYLVIQARIRAASAALLKPDVSIATVANDFGFCDQSAFTRQFRKHTGLTPLAFVRKYGNIETA